jgi:predicted transcriptional regulator
MRTTIDLKPEHRARLLELAARRGEKGFSVVIGEAIEAHLRAEECRRQLVRQALKTLGRLSAHEAEKMRKEVAVLRKRLPMAG